MKEISCDVLVAGGGVAGIAAALEAARSGLRVILVEKTVMTGGLATSGLIHIYLPLCDGMGRQVSFGLAEELLQWSMRYGPGEVPDWRRGGGARYRCVFAPASAVLAYDEELVRAGVSVWYDTLVCGAVMDGPRVRGLEVENKSGRVRLLAGCVVDATGDADVARQSGAATVDDESYLVVWSLDASLAAARKAADSGDGSGLLVRRITGADPSGRHDQPVGDAAASNEKVSAAMTVTGIDGKSASAFVAGQWRLLRERYAADQAKAGPDGRNAIYPLTLPSMPLFRRTRRIAARTVLTEADAKRSFADSVGMGADWRKSGPVWELPYGALVPERVEGLLAAGRCIGSSGDAWEVTRVIPLAAVTGQAAGAAAALAVRRGVSPSEVPSEEVQKALRARGIPLTRGELSVPPLG